MTFAVIFLNFRVAILFANAIEVNVRGKRTSQILMYDVLSHGRGLILELRDFIRSGLLPSWLSSLYARVMRIFGLFLGVSHLAMEHPAAKSVPMKSLR